MRDRRPPVRPGRSRGRAVLAACAVALAGAGATACASAAPGGVSAGVPARTAACFAVESLPPAVRETAERWLLEAGDREALYTLDGGLKPLSSDIASYTWRVAPTPDATAADTLARWRRAAAALTCGDLHFAVQVFGAVFPSRTGDTVRTASVAVGHRRMLDAAIGRQASWFASVGITAGQPVGDLLALVDAAPRADRWRGYGLLFGYPEAAVDFFVSAGRQGDSTRTLVPRDFRRHPTWRKSAPPPGETDSLTSFVYAVPKGAPWSAADSALARAVAPRYAAYRAWRDAAPRTGADAVQWWRRRLSATSTP